MLAAKEMQLREFQEEMTALKENLLADDKEPCCLSQRSVPKDPCRLHRENDQIMCNMEQWAKEQKIANEKLGNKLREQVKYIAKLTGEKEIKKRHSHSQVTHVPGTQGQVLWIDGSSHLPLLWQHFSCSAAPAPARLLHPGAPPSSVTEPGPAGTAPGP
uniref:Polyamine modulated factor 1 binding protein 1 n=1 Tax=Spermophilus dauricus TaxID=99837 RepID=A0A8C9QLI1_SPEDA